MTIALIAGALLTAFFLMLAFSSTFRTSVAALGDIGGTLVSADCNQVPVGECGALALKARHNVDVVTRAAEYMVAVGGNTQVFLEIARIAAAADADCPRLAEVLDLAVMKQSESMRVLALAESACRPDSEQQSADWQQEFEALASTAEYETVEAGLASRRRN